MKSNISIGERLKSLRNTRELSISDVANICLVDSLTYSRYEENIMYPPLDVQIKLSKFYQVTLGYLSGLEDVKETENIESKISKTEVLEKEHTEYRDIDLLVVPTLSLVKKIKTPYEKVRKGNFFYLYSPCNYNEYKINEKTLLLIKQSSTYKSGNILLVERKGIYFIGRCIKSERKLILCNSEFDDGFKEFQYNYKIIGRVVEATIAL